MSIWRQVRVVGAIMLVISIFLPLSECSRRDNTLPSASQNRSIAQRLFPQDNGDFQYQYASRTIRPSTWQAGLFTLIALLWPITALIFDRKVSGRRFGWMIYVLELLLCAGTIYWLFTFTALGRALYGTYVVVIGAAIFGGATLILSVQNVRHSLTQRRGLKLSNFSP